jgi:glucosamine--fructose-6-phosphate aminotransferase (isomerizing)
MCGIVAATANRDVVPILLAGLQALEYRGYDSAGFSILSEDGAMNRLRTEGKVARLRQMQDQAQHAGHSGIAHTRWATHGRPNTENAHPHLSSDDISVVHNGIIENHEALREELIQAGYHFDSETDTEVIAHLVDHHRRQSGDLLAATLKTVNRLEGAFAIAVLSRSEPDRAVGARRGSPLVAGLGFGENFIASDIHALLPVTNRFIYLNEGDVVDISSARLRVYTTDGSEVSRPVRESDLSAEAVDRGQYRHFMLKEIFEQPGAVAETLEGRMHHGRLIPEAFGHKAQELFEQARGVHLVACGTSFHAGLVARYWLESFAGIPCSVEVASEYRYRDVVVPDDTLFLTVSQSGETADTLAALQLAKSRGYLGSLVICNVPESSLVRESDCALMTRAGPEIGVASTKAFTTQLTLLALVALELGRRNGLEEARYKDLASQLDGLPGAISKALALSDPIRALAGHFGPRHHALFLGRGSHYPIAMEGALKLKEISYIHAEAYPAGELKHGPLALVDENMPVIAVAPNNELLEKLKSNIEEVKARGGELYLVVDRESVHNIKLDKGHVIEIDHVGAFISPIVMTVPLQLLAYHVAVIKGTDIDQPRNLAKSVTVE